MKKLLLRGWIALLPLSNLSRAEPPPLPLPPNAWIQEMHLRRAAEERERAWRIEAWRREQVRRQQAWQQHARHHLEAIRRAWFSHETSGYRGESASPPLPKPTPPPRRPLALHPSPAPQAPPDRSLQPPAQATAPKSTKHQESNRSPSHPSTLPPRASESPPTTPPPSISASTPSIHATPSEKPLTPSPSQVNFPTAVPIPGRKGMVKIPVDGQERILDVKGIPSGNLVEDPITKIRFYVP
ncbi:hypothetical protein HNR46_000499 [Haloferula luteola]|uniref:AMIN domain-containing protein n=1 Tax=Haloferula luteola TaxID=595692 RepID=A0A840UX18_9BACT|nr:hypothetical protein [Haloferula luteola]MBB5350275.1 hypothetical protein [Haloferula luteola]